VHNCSTQPDFNSDQSAQNHWETHAQGIRRNSDGSIKSQGTPDMPEYDTPTGPAEYRQAARDFMSGDGPEGSHSLYTRAGGMFRVHPDSGVFGYMNSSGTISTFFRVTRKDAFEYFLDQFRHA
jgi:hypothetical protein